MSERRCPDCGRGMEQGFVPDLNHALIGRSTWYRGEPEPAKFFGLKTASIDIDHKQLLPITAYRCTACGLLQFYALPAEEA